MSSKAVATSGEDAQRNKTSQNAEHASVEEQLHLKMGAKGYRRDVNESLHLKLGQGIHVKGNCISRWREHKCRGCQEEGHNSSNNQRLHHKMGWGQNGEKAYLEKFREETAAEAQEQVTPQRGFGVVETRAAPTCMQNPS